LLAMMQSTPLYLGNWPGMLWGAEGFKLGAELHIALAFVGMLAWLRSLGIGGIGAATGALIYSASPTILSWTCIQPYHQTLSWWPLLLWAAHRVLANPRPASVAVLALVGAATVLTGGIQLIVYGAYTVTAFALIRLGVMGVRRRPDLGRVVLG